MTRTQPKDLSVDLPKATLDELAAFHRETAKRYRADAAEREDWARVCWAKAQEAEARATAYADAAAKLEGGQ